MHIINFCFYIIGPFGIILCCYKEIQFIFIQVFQFKKYKQAGYEWFCLFSLAEPPDSNGDKFCTSGANECYGSNAYTSNQPSPSRYCLFPRCLKKKKMQQNQESDFFPFILKKVIIHIWIDYVQL